MIQNSSIQPLHPLPINLKYKPVDTEGQCILLSVNPIKFQKCGFTIFTIVSIMLVGIPVLITYWYPWLKKTFYYSFSTQQQATHYYVLNYDNTYSIAAKRITTEEEKLVNSGETSYFYNRYLKYCIKGDEVQAAIFNASTYIHSIYNTKDYQGLTADNVHHLRNYFGIGAMVIKKPSCFILFVREMFRPLYIFILYSVAVWIYIKYYYYSGVIMFTSTVALILNLVQLNQLNKKIFTMAFSQVDVHILRDGAVIKSSSTEVVPGDIVFLKDKVKIPFDGFILEGNALINECALTGESVPVVKKAGVIGSYGQNHQADKVSIVYEGTQLIQANFKKPMVMFDMYREQYGIPVCVLRTNFVTMKGQLIRIISFPKERENKFQKQSTKFLLFLFLLALASYAILIIKINPYVQPVYIFTKFLDLVTITVPPGLPISMTVGIVFALEKLKSAQIFCISPQKVIMGGMVDYICFDKTGTLTQDYMDFYSFVPFVNRQFLAPLNHNTTQTKSIVEIAKEIPQLIPAFHNMATNHSLTKLQESQQMIGDPMEMKLLEFGQYKFAQNNSDVEVIYSIQGSDQILDVYRRFQFDSDVQRMSVIAKVRGKQQQFYSYVKGSPQMMLKIMEPNSIPSDYSVVLKKYASMGLRVLTIANKKISNSNVAKLNREQAESHVRFDGFQVFENKLKKQTAPAIQQLHNARIPCVMITGDNPLTGSNIAYKCKIAQNNKSMTIIDYVKGNFVTEEFFYEDQTQQQQNTLNLNQQSFAGQIQLKIMTDVYQTNHAFKTQNNIVQSKSQFSLTVQSFLNEMTHKATNLNYQFCITGTAFNTIFPGEIKHNEHTKQFFEHVKVYARAKPNDKVRVVTMYQMLGWTTAMCGDGANDCGALKQADVGLSLSPAQASISSPFTSKIPHIGSIVTLLKECRAGLVTNFSLFNIMALYSLTQYTTSIITQFFFAYPSDLQYLYWDLACNFFFFLTIGHTGTAQTLSVQKPRSSLFSLSNLIYVFFMAIAQFLCQITIILAMRGPFAERIQYYTYGGETVNKQKYDSEGAYSFETPQSSALFLVSNFMYIYSLLAFSISKPWRKDFWTNIPFMIVLIIFFTYSVLIVMIPSTRISTFFIINMNNLQFQGFILGVATAFGLFVYFNQKYIFQNFFSWIIKKYPNENWI